MPLQNRDNQDLFCYSIYVGVDGDDDELWLGRIDPSCNLGVGRSSGLGSSGLL